MSFRLVILPPGYHSSWPDQIRQAIPTAEVSVFSNHRDAFNDIEVADAAFGYVPPDLFASAKGLRWIQCHDRHAESPEG